MKNIHISTEVPDDRRIVICLPPDVPTGKVELDVRILSNDTDKSKPARSSLADWAEEQAEDWGTDITSTDVSSFTGRNR